MEAVYLIHFRKKYKHAQHYIGWASNLDSRINAHKKGYGARLIQVINEAGIKWELVRTWKGEDRHFERKLKNRKNASRLCPICKGENSNEQRK